MTTLLLKEILAHYDAGQNYTEIAQALKIPVNTAWRWCHKFGRPARPQRQDPRPQKMYYVYLRATDQLIAAGSARECANRMGVQLSSFYSIVSRSNHGVNKKYEIYKEEMSKEEMSIDD